MKRVWRPAATLLAGLLVTAVYAVPQAYTISARPGALNYVEGHAFLDGRPVSDKGVKSTFLNANDTLSTDAGKAEVLLTPGVFLRIGDNSAVKMVSPSLTNTQVEVTRGEAMVEAAGLIKDNDIQILDHNGIVKIQKDGLYRFLGGNPPTAAVIEGKAEVVYGDQKIELGKGHETIISAALKSEKFDPKKEDDLYAWSNVRSEYDAAASYQTAKNVTINNYGGWWGYGFGGWYGPGWYWDNGFDSWAWLPAYGAFYSPFGWGFYAPGLIGYAPIVTVPVYGGGYWKNHPKPVVPGVIKAAVAVNPKHPPAIGAVASNSPAAYEAARSVAAHSFAATGFSSANGSHISAGHAAFVGGNSGGGHVSGGGGAVGHAGGFGGGGGGGHASGGGGGGGGHR